MSDFFLKMAEKIAVEKYGGHLTIMRFTGGWKAIFGTPNRDCGDSRFEFSGLPHHTTIEGALIDLISHGYAAYDGRADKEKEARLVRCKIETEKFDSEYVDLTDLQGKSLTCSFSSNHSGVISVSVKKEIKLFTAVYGGPVSGCYDIDGKPILDGTKETLGYVLRDVWENAQ